MNINFTPLREAQVLHMLDRANLTSYVVTYDDYGDEVLTPTVQSGVECGFSYARTFDKDNGVWLSTGDVANLRLPIGTSITGLTEVTIVSGIAAPGDWKVDGNPQVANTCIVVSLKKGTV